MSDIWTIWFFSPIRKDALKGMLADLSGFLLEKLGLSLKPRATLINRNLHGLPFPGFRVFPNLLRIKGENLKRMKRRMQERAWQWREGKITTEGFVSSMQSMVSHAAFGDTLRMRRSVLALSGHATGQEV